MMKIFHINSYYSKSLFYKNLYDWQVKNKIDICVFVPLSTKNALIDNNHGAYSDLFNSFENIDRYFFHHKQNKIFKAMLERHELTNVDVVHAHSLFTNGNIAYMIKQQFGIPYIVAVRNTDVNIFYKKLIYLRSLGNRILNEASAIVFLSNVYKEFVIDNLIPKSLRDSIRQKSYVIENGIDNYWFENIGSSKIINKNKIRLIQVGEINKNKNLSASILALKYLNELMSDVTLTAIGKLRENRIIEKHSNNKNIIIKKLYEQRTASFSI